MLSFLGPLEGMFMLRIHRPCDKSLRTSHLKTVRRTVFLTVLTLSGFESLDRKKKTPPDGDAFFFGPLEGIRTPDLQNRNLLRYPTAPRADIKGTA